MLDTLKALQCKNCGAAVTFSGSEQSLHCDFCGSHFVAAAGTPVELPSVNPNGESNLKIAPATVDERAARAIFIQWRKTGHLVANAPEEVEDSVQRMRLTCVYLPYLHCESTLKSEWSGLYKEITGYEDRRKVVTDISGKEHVRYDREPIVQWIPMTGTVTNSYEEFYRASSVLVGKENVNLNVNVDYETFKPEHLSGWRAQLPTENIEALQKIFATVTTIKQRAECGAQIEKLTNFDTQVMNVQFEYAFFPVWIIHYEFENKSYRAIINARSGEVFGTRPISRKKVLILAGIASAILIGGFIAAWIASSVMRSNEIQTHLQAAEDATRISKNHTAAYREYLKVLALDPNNSVAVDGARNSHFSEALDVAEVEEKSFEWKEVVATLTAALNDIGNNSHPRKGFAKEQLQTANDRIADYDRQVQQGIELLNQKKFWYAKKRFADAGLAWGRETDDLKALLSKAETGLVEDERKKKYDSLMKSALENMESGKWTLAEDAISAARQSSGEQTPEIRDALARVSVAKAKIVENEIQPSAMVRKTESKIVPAMNLPQLDRPSPKLTIQTAPWRVDGKVLQMRDGIEIIAFAYIGRGVKSHVVFADGSEQEVSPKDVRVIKTKSIEETPVVEKAGLYFENAKKLLDEGRELKMSGGDNDATAATLFHESTRLYRTVGDRMGIAVSEELEAECITSGKPSSDNWSKAADLFDDAASMLAAEKEVSSRAHCLFKEASCLQIDRNEKGDWKRAASLYQKAANLFLTLQDKLNAGMSFHQQAYCLLENNIQNMTPEIRTILHQSAQLSREAGDEENAKASEQWATWQKGK